MFHLNSSHVSVAVVNVRNCLIVPFCRPSPTNTVGALNSMGLNFNYPVAVNAIQCVRGGLQI